MEAAKLQCLFNLKVSLERTQHVLAGVSTEAGGDIWVQATEQSSWVTVRWGREESVNEAGPGLEHPNKYEQLHDVGETSQGVAMMDQSDTLSCQGKNSTSEGGGKAEKNLYTKRKLGTYLTADGRGQHRGAGTRA